MDKITEKCLNDIRMRIAELLKDYEEELIKAGRAIISQCNICGEYVVRTRFLNGLILDELEIIEKEKSLNSASLHKCNNGSVGTLQVLGVVNLNTESE